jgi:hypothetical protein
MAAPASANQESVLEFVETKEAVVQETRMSFAVPANLNYQNLGAAGAGSAALLAVIVLVLWANSVSAAEAASGEADRRKLLGQHLGQYDATLEPYISFVMGGLYVITGAAIAIGSTPGDFGSEDTRGQVLKWSTAGALGVLGGIELAGFVDARDQGPVILGTTYGSFGVIGVGAALLSDLPVPERQSLAIFGGTGFAVDTLLLIDSLMRPRTSRGRLARYGKILTNAGVHLSKRELALIEAEYKLTERPLTDWMGLTAVVGGLGSMLPAVWAKSEKEQLFCVGIGGIMAYWGVMQFTMFSNRGYTQYAHALKSFSLAPLGPNGTAGASMRVRF